MLTPQEKQGWLEALKELKAEYYIGSLRAYKFIKANNLLEKVQQQNPAFSISKISRLAKIAGLMIQDILEIHSIAVSTPQHPSLSAIHLVALPYHFPPWQQLETQAEEMGINIWKVDITTLLNKFLSRITPAVNNWFILHLMATKIAQALHKETLVLEHSATGEKVTLARVRTEPRFRTWDEQFMLALAQDVFETGSDQQGHTLAAEDMAELGMALEKTDMVALHPVLHRLMLRQAISRRHAAFESHLQFLSTNRNPTEDWLYDERLYERAENEYVLGYREIKRRILLNTVHRHQSSGLFTSKKGAEIVNELMEISQGNVRRYAARRHRLMAGGAPEVLIHAEEKLLRPHQYELIALHQNKNWLIDFLSR